MRKGKFHMWRQRQRSLVTTEAEVVCSCKTRDAKSWKTTRSCNESKKCSIQSLRGSWLSWCLVFRLLVSRLRNNKCLLFKTTQFVGLCYGCLRKLIQFLSSALHITSALKKNVHSIKERLIWQYLISHSALMGDSFQFQYMTEDSLRFRCCKTWHFKDIKPVSA